MFIIDSEFLGLFITQQMINLLHNFVDTVNLGNASDIFWIFKNAICLFSFLSFSLFISLFLSLSLSL